MSSSMPLAMVSEGSECMVREVCGSTSISTRLRELGFVSEARVKVLKADGRGLIVGLNGSRLALSRGVASQIMVC